MLPPSCASADPLVDSLREIAQRNHVSVRELAVDAHAREVDQQLWGATPVHGYLMNEPHRAPAVLFSLSQELTRAPGVARVSAEMETLLFGGRSEPSSEPSTKPMHKLSASNLEDAIAILYQGTGDRFMGREKDQFKRDVELLTPYAEYLEAMVPILMSLRVMSDVRDQWQEESPFPRGGSFDHKTRQTQDSCGTLWKWFAHSTRRVGQP